MKIARRVATISPQVKNWLVQFTEASLLPPPTNVQQLIKEEVIVDELLATTADAVIWLKKALVDAYLSKNIKETVCLLLSTDAFWVGMFEDTPHFQRESLFQSLQLFCQEELNNIGKGVKYYYNSHNLSDVLGTFTLPVHPELNCEEVHLRQDHPLIGLTPINSAIHDNDRNTTIYERDESVYIHQLRIIAMCLNKNYQDRVRYIVEEYEGEHIGCSIKGDVRIRNKWRAKEDHGKEIRPRPSCNIDVNRCCATFTEPEQLKKAAIALVEHFGGYAARVKNGFELSVEAASKSFHYRSYMINLIVDFGFTYGQMFHKSNKYNGMLEKYLASPPSNPNEVCVEVDEKRVKHKRFLWNKWRHEAILACKQLKCKEMANRPVRLICEVQLLLRPYLYARQKMHLLYKIVRADTKESLKKQFATIVGEESVLEENATWDSEENKCLIVSNELMSKGMFSEALMLACENGFKKVLENVVKNMPDKRMINQPNKKGETPLFLASFYGNIDIVCFLLQQDNINIYVVRKDRDMYRAHTPLSIACQNNHVDIVRLLLSNGVKHDVEDLGRILFNSVCLNNIDVVRTLLLEEDINLNYVGEEGKTALQVAIKQGYAEIEQMLRDHVNGATIRFFRLQGGAFTPNLESSIRSP
jgi:hypothetical protein